MNEFSATELERYSRQMRLPDVGLNGQKKLRTSRVLIVGAGGLGTPAALYLAAAGVGTLGLIESDAVELSNLNRQILYRADDVGSPKLQAAGRELRSFNPDLVLNLHPLRLRAADAFALVTEYDLVIDATDNFATRYLLNDACIFAAKPLVYGSVSRLRGMVSALVPGASACFRCLHPEPPPPEEAPSCDEGGVLGVVAGTIALLQATECLKLLLGIGTSLAGRVLYYDAFDSRFQEIFLSRDPECPGCGANPRVQTVQDLQDTTAMCSAGEEIAPEDLRPEKSLLIVDVRESAERVLGHIEGSMHLPLSEIEKRSSELNAAADIVVYCKSGQRSARAIRILHALGFRNVRNLRGGFDAYSAGHWTTPNKQVKRLGDY